MLPYQPSARDISDPSYFRLTFEGPQGQGEETLLLSHGTIHGLGHTDMQVSGVYDVNRHGDAVDLMLAMSVGESTVKSGPYPDRREPLTGRLPVVIKTSLPLDGHADKLTVKSAIGPVSVRLRRLKTRVPANS